MHPSDSPVSRSLNASLGSGIGAIVVVSVLSGAVTLTAARGLRHDIAERDLSAEIARGLSELQVAMLNQETGLRGNLLTGQEASLAPYRDGRAAFGRTDARLHQLVAAGSPEAARLADADAAARAWADTIGEPARRAMADPATRQVAISLEASGTGRRYFDRVREALTAASEAARDRRRLWDERLVRDGGRVAAAIGTGIALTVAICLGVTIALHRIVTRPLTALAESMRRLARRDLQAPVPATEDRSEVGAMARAVAVFKVGLIELDRTSVLRATTDTLPALVGYVDASRRIRFLNGEFAGCFSLGPDLQMLRGQRMAELFPDDSFPGLREGELDRAFDGETRRFEHHLRRPGETEARIFEAVFRPHRGESGILLGVVTLLTDITERKRIDRLLAAQRADLARSNEELEQFAYVASHDLKAPLRGIENLVTWIEEDLGALVEGGVRTNMDLLRSRVRRLDSLLDDLLAYSRAGRTDAGEERVDTHALVVELAALVSPPPGFRIVAVGTLPVLVTHRAPLLQALQNLIGNAIKHHDRPGAGEVRVEASFDAGGVPVFTVTDDGPGIPEQFRERVFAMFQTLRPRDEVEGSGMGLAIVRKLVERRGGTVWLSDRAAELSRPDTATSGLAVHFTWPMLQQREG